jgi:hypothetical protein
MNLVIPKDTLDKVLNYLASRPWIETNQLIVGLSKLQQLPEEKPKEDSKAQ